MKTNLKILIEETQADLDMIKKIGLKDKGYEELREIRMKAEEVFALVGLKRLKDLDAELREIRMKAEEVSNTPNTLASMSFHTMITLINEILGEI